MNTEKLSEKIRNIFAGNVVREDISQSVAVVVPVGVTNEDARYREEIERKRREMGALYLCHESNRVQRLDGRTFQRAA